MAKVYGKPDRSKKGGVAGKILCLVIGFVVGIVGTLGGIAGAGYYIYSQPVDKTLSLVDKSGAIYTTLFGNDDSVGLLNEKYASSKIGVLLGDSINAVNSLKSGGSLSDLNEISPKIGSLVEKLLKTTDKYAIPLEKDELMTKPLGELSGYLGSSVKETPLGDLLEGLGKGGEPILMALSYGEEGVDYTLDENGKVVMLGDAKKTTINDLMKEGGVDSLLNKVTLDSVMTIDANDTVMCAIAYGSSNRYTVVDGKAQMTQITYTYEDKGDGYALYDDKDEPVSATVESIAAKTLKVTFASGEVQYVSLNDDGVGVAYSDATFLAPVYYKKTKIGDLTEDSMSIINNIYLKDALGVDAKQHKVLISLAYGEENVDFHYVGEGDDKTIEMIGAAKPRTIGELRNRGGNLINDIPLSDIMATDTDDGLVMYLLYGKENIHYSVDADDNVTMLQKQIAIDGDVVYNEYGEKLAGYTLDTANETYVAPDGTQYKYVASAGLTLTTEDDTLADVYYLTNLNGTAVYFSKTTLGDMAGSDNVISSLTKRITLKEVIDEETMNSNIFFKHVQDETIETLPDAVNSLTLQQVYEKDIYKTDADGNFLDKNGNVTTNKDEYAVEHEWWYLLHDASVCEADHGASCDKNCIQDYNVTQLSKLISNMRKNIEGATLNQLSEDGMITALDKNTLNSTIKTQIKGVPLDMTGLPTDKQKLGEFTVVEMLNYVNAIFKVVEALESL